MFFYYVGFQNPNKKYFVCMHQTLGAGYLTGEEASPANAAVQDALRGTAASAYKDPHITSSRFLNSAAYSIPNSWEIQGGL